jgi:hypothetical protein
MPEIELNFDEIPLAERVFEGQQYRLDVYAYGVLTIEYDDNAWNISHLRISASALVTNEWRYVEIEKSDPLWPIVEDAIRKYRSEWIDGAIGDDMRARGEWRDENEEHRLSARQLGIAS